VIGGAREAVAFDVPAHAGQDASACGGERAEVGDGGAGDERAAALGREPEDLEHPAERHPLQHGGRGCHAHVDGVLVPGPGEPVRRERRRQHPTRHEAEEPRAGDRDGGGRRHAIEQLDDPRGVGRCLGEWLVERGERRHRLGRRRHPALREVVEIAERAGSGIGEEITHQRAAD
jgi:hypothetical protein